MSIFAIILFTFHATAVPLNPERRQAGNVYPQGPSDAVVLDLPSATAVPPPTASGSIYGTEALLGNDGNPVKGSAVVENFNLVPGQLEDPTEGLELDFNLVDKPQPIRGTDGRSGGTDPGPGKCSLSSVYLCLTIERHKPLWPFQQWRLCLSRIWYWGCCQCTMAPRIEP